MERKLLLIFTRTPLHVGAGASVGAIDQPIIRERHTGFPVIPATSLKGTFADAWNDTLEEEQTDRGTTKRVRVKKDGTSSDAAWLFGSDNANHPFAGALIFTEARLLAFPVRSAKGSFAWITCPLILRRAARDGVINLPANLPNPSDTQAVIPEKTPLAIDGKIVLEEYTFTKADKLPEDLGNAFAKLLTDGQNTIDPVWAEVASHLVILSDGMMSYFARNACEVAQHVRIDDETGTAAHGALFNQENVPSETLFYSVMFATRGRTPGTQNKSPAEAFEAFANKLNKHHGLFQFGGDASTGLGWCTVLLKNVIQS